MVLGALVLMVVLVAAIVMAGNLWFRQAFVNGFSRVK
jgi:hypothetical protein